MSFPSLPRPSRRRTTATLQVDELTYRGSAVTRKVPAGKLDIHASGVFDLFPLLGIDRSHDARGCTEHQAPRWNLCAGSDERTCTHEAAAADARGVEHRRTHADQAQILDGAAVQDHAVADRAVLADHGTELLRRHVYDGSILHARTCADPDRHHITAQHSRVPDRRLVSDLDISDHRTRLCEKYALADPRARAAIAANDRRHGLFRPARSLVGGGEQLVEHGLGVIA